MAIAEKSTAMSIAEEAMAIETGAEEALVKEALAKEALTIEALAKTQETEFGTTEYWTASAEYWTAEANYGAALGLKSLETYAQAKLQEAMAEYNTTATDN